MIAPDISKASELISLDFLDRKRGEQKALQAVRGITVIHPMEQFGLPSGTGLFLLTGNFFV